MIESVRYLNPLEIKVNKKYYVPHKKFMPVTKQPINNRRKYSRIYRGINITGKFFRLKKECLK